MLLGNCIIAFTSHWKCCPHINVAIWGWQGYPRVCLYLSVWIAEEGSLTFLPGCPFSPSSLNIWPSRCFMLTPKAYRGEYSRNDILLLGPTWQNLSSKSGPCWQPSRSFIAVKGGKSETGVICVRGKWLEFKLAAKGGMLGRAALSSETEYSTKCRGFIFLM